MANDDFARGFVPLNTGGKGTVEGHLYQASTVTDLAIGMMVQLSNGRVSRAAVTGLTPVLGVAGGFQKAKAGAPNELAPWLDVSGLTSDDWYVFVWDDPSQEFYIQEDTGGTALTATAPYCTIGGLYQASSISTDSGITRLEIDASTAVATTGQPIQILRLHNNINTDGTDNALGDYAKWVVKFAWHQKGNVNDSLFA